MPASALRPGFSRRLRTPRAVMALVLREMATTYGRSPGGYLWAILDPVGAIALFSIIFSVMFSSPGLGTSFPLFYATGYLPFMMYNDVANKTAVSIRFSRPLLQYPSVSFLDALLARFLLNGLTHVLVFFVVTGGLWLFLDAIATLNFPAILLSMTMALALALGIGALNCYLMARFPVWERVWQIATRPLFIVSGVFFLYDTLPENIRFFMWFNPLTHVIGVMRQGFYATYQPHWISPVFVFAISSLCFTLGLALLYRHHRDLLND